MDQATTELLSRRLHIAQDPIVREEYEIIFLQGCWRALFDWLPSNSLEKKEENW